MSLADYMRRRPAAEVSDRGRESALDGTGKKVRLRVLRGGTAAQRSRFLDLARLWQGLEHPQVVPVLEVGEEEGIAYLVEDPPAGLDLSTIVSLETSDLQSRIDLLEQIAATLDLAHDRQILHRGLEPSEVRVTSDGEAVVAGFGVGRLLTTADTGSDMESAATTVLARLPPEQVLGGEADVAGDVYAFGILAHELLAGEFPFSTTSATTLLADKMKDRPPSLAAACPGCPGSVADLVAKCLARDPGERPDGFAEIGRRLGEAKEVVGEAVDEDFPTSDPEAEIGAVDAAPTATAPPPEAKGVGTLLSDSWQRWRPLVIERPRWVPALVAVLVVAVVVVLFSRSEHRPAASEPPPIEAMAPERFASIAPAENGVLRIDARPWAEIFSITDAGGQQVSLPPLRYTPLSLPLPEGLYSVELRRPDRTGPVICTATVVDGKVADCVAEFLAVSPQQYFRESGWWR